MALLKDLIVTGASRYLGDAYFKTIKEGVWNGTRLGKGYVPTQTVYTDANNIIQGSAADQDVLTIKNTSTAKKAWIKYIYSTSNTPLGKLGIGEIGSAVTPYWTNSNGTDYTIYHSGNLPTKIDSASQADKLANDITLTIGNKSQQFNANSKVTYSLKDIGVNEIQINGVSIGTNTLNIKTTATTEGGVTTFSAINTWRDIKIGGTTIGQNTFNIVAGNDITISSDNGKATIAVNSNKTQNWDKAYTWYSTITEEDDANDTIDTWEEIVKFVNGYKETDTLSSLFSGKLNLTALTNGTNIDELQTAGFYYSPANVQTTNPPGGGTSTTNAYSVLMAPSSTTTKSAKNRIGFYANGSMYISYTDTSGSGWYKILTTGNSRLTNYTKDSTTTTKDTCLLTINGTSATIPNTGYVVKKTGDTMTGQLQINHSANTTSTPLIIYSGASKYTRILFYGTSSKTCWGGIGFTEANKLVRWDNNDSLSYQVLDNSNSDYILKYSDDGTYKYGAKINGEIINLVENTNALYTASTSDNTDYLFAFTTTNTGYKKYFTHSDFKFNHTSTSKTVTLGNATFTYNSTTGALEITSC